MSHFKLHLLIYDCLTSKSKTQYFNRVLLESIKIICSFVFRVDKNLTHSKNLEIAGVYDNIVLTNSVSENNRHMRIVYAFCFSFNSLIFGKNVYINTIRKNITYIINC